MISLEQASVLVIGAGGLGTPALLALAVRGVRRIGILEPDRVELSNLHRQILYREEDIGRFKAECASAALSRRFPRLEIEAYVASFEAETHDLISSYDIVLDGTDSFDTKLAISDACTDRGILNVFASVAGVEGQVLAVAPHHSACVRCLFDDAPGPAEAPTCDELGILGPIAGVVAAKQVASAAALLAGRTEVLDRIWLYDGAGDSARTVRLRRAPDCRGCGRNVLSRGATAPLSLQDVEAPVVDLSGQICPATYTETRRVLERLPDRGRVWIQFTSDEAARNVPRSAIAAGHRVLARVSDGRTHRLLLERGSTEAPSEDRI
jgi:adenylyltransferase/sulfurtransferase